MVFYYFFPGLDRQRATAVELRRRGVGEALRDCLRSVDEMHRRLIVRPVHANGPDGSSGVIVAAVPRDGTEITPGYHPDRQEWRDCGTFWLGWESSSPPTPATLARDEQITGYEITLGDGLLWTAPVLRWPGGHSNLPQSWGVDGRGEFVQRILPEWEAAWQLAGDVWDVFTGAIPIEKPEAFAMCVKLLAINYRIGPHECSVLGLLNDRNYPRVFKAAVDGEKLEAFYTSEEGQAAIAELTEKKSDGSADSGPSSSPGAAAASPATPPPAATCISPH